MKKFILFTIVIAFSAAFLFVGCKNDDELTRHEENQMERQEADLGDNVEDYIVEGWVDDDRFHIFAAGEGSNFESAKEAALLMAQARAQEIFTRYYIEATSGAVDGVSMGKAVRKRVEGWANSGYIIALKYDEDNHKANIVYEIFMRDGKNKMKDRNYFESTLENE